MSFLLKPITWLVGILATAIVDEIFRRLDQPRTLEDAKTTTTDRAGFDAYIAGRLRQPPGGGDKQ